MNIKLEIILFIIIGIFLLIQFLWMVKTENRLKRFFLGKKAKDLEDTIVILEDEMKKLIDAKMRIDKELVDVNSKLKKSIRGLETIRFNPFADQGSNQSFSIGFLNEDDDGVVISSLYSRDRMSVFAKPIKNGKSQYELTEEEKEVLTKAKV
jgi:hypothetical protein